MIKAPFNMLTFNDGYHINHHIAPNCHWADLPADFERCAKRFEEEGAFCFSGIDNFGIGLNVCPFCPNLVFALAIFLRSF